MKPRSEAYQSCWHASLFPLLSLFTSFSCFSYLFGLFVSFFVFQLLKSSPEVKHTKVDEMLPVFLRCFCGFPLLFSSCFSCFFLIVFLLPITSKNGNVSCSTNTTCHIVSSKLVFYFGLRISQKKIHIILSH